MSAVDKPLPVVPDCGDPSCPQHGTPHVDCDLSPAENAKLIAGDHWDPSHRAYRALSARRIYVASSWRNLVQPGVVTILRRLGHEVYDFRAHRFDIEALQACHVCVLVLPSGRSASWEFGYAMGQGKPGVVLTLDACEPELMYREAAIVTSLDELIDAFDFDQRAPRGGDALRPSWVGSGVDGLAPTRLEAAKRKLVASLTPKEIEILERRLGRPLTDSEKGGAR